jgi:hypothetical protein
MTVSMPTTGSMPLRDTSGVAAGGTLLPGAATPDTSAASTYTDLNGLAALKRDPDSPQAIKAVAEDRKSTRLNSSHRTVSRMPSSA